MENSEIDVSGTWAQNWDLFVEIGAAASVCTRLVRMCVPERVEASPWFRRFLHYMPVLAAGLFLGAVYLWPNGGRVVLHAVTIGGMSGNLRDVFNESFKRLRAPKPAALEFRTETTTTLKESGAAEPSEPAKPSLPRATESAEIDPSGASEEKGKD